MRNFYIKNVKKTQIREIDSESVSLSGISKKKKENLMIKQISKNMFYILLFIFISISIILLVLKIKFRNNINNYNQKSNQINSETKRIDIQNIKSMNNINFIKGFKLSNINETDVQKYFEYMNYAKNDIYLTKQNLVEVKKPKISIIISTYNRENYVKSTTRSIQNQNLKEIEIIFIDDFSTDNTVKYIKEEQKNDPRIILYQNKQNMGTLYSKSIGVLHARGNYVYSLDSDDMLCSENYLNTLYQNTDNGKMKFVEARALYVDLNSKKISKKKPNWMVLWSKLIKTEYYRKAIYSVGYDALISRVTVLDDDIIFLFMLSNGYHKLIEDIGVCHFTHPGSHVFFSRFAGGKNTKNYCLNMVTTIRAFYKVLHRNIGKNYGNFLLKSHFFGGICCYYKKDEIVKELLDDYKKEKEEEKKNEISKKMNL